mgnify:CR=1 FL=1
MPVADLYQSISIEGVYRSPGNIKFTIEFSGFTVDDAGKWLIDPLKQTEIGQIILAGNLIGNLPRIKAYASDFLHMVPNSCRHDDFHEVIHCGIYLSQVCNKLTIKVRVRTLFIY